ncbi:MAG: hypothetical protein IPL83_01030 [Bdellovibrionales bacterium]|nr:hypothetical protein [Bdellovibrionales bacterium]
MNSVWVLLNRFTTMGASRANHQIAILDKNIGLSWSLRTKAKLALDVATRFVDYSLKLKLLDIQERQLKLVKTEFEMVSNGYHRGLKTKRVSSDSKSYPIRREIDVTDAKNNVIYLVRAAQGYWSKIRESPGKGLRL